MHGAGSTISKPWNAYQKIAFRYVFAYLFCYIFPFPLAAIPYVSAVTYPWNWLSTAFVSMMSAHCFHITPDWSHLSTGSGDQLVRYVELASYAIISLPVTILWSILDKKRRDYSRMFAFLRLWSLLFVASNMLTYGIHKIVPSQFPPLVNSRLVERVGDMSPMGMLWTFMSTSKSYTIFSGVAEFTAGLLLAFPPTSLVGALLSSAVSLQIVALNMCYDVPVKILSLHLLMLSFVVLSPAIPSLFSFFILHRASKLFDALRLFKRGKLNIASWIFVWSFLLFSTVTALESSRSGLSEVNQMRDSKIEGVWRVVVAQCDDSEQDDYMKSWNVLTDGYGDNLVITSKSGLQMYLKCKFSEDGNSVDIDGGRKSGRWSAHFALLAPDATHLVLDGIVGSAKAKITLEKDERPFSLIDRGFHWVNEFPYNR